MEELDELTGNSDDTSTEPEETKEQLVERIQRLEAEKKNILDGNSRSGREFKAFKEETSQNYRELMEKINELSAARNSLSGSDSIEDEDNDYDMTEIQKVRKIAREEARREREQSESELKALRSKYVSDYESAMLDMGAEEDPEIYQAIVAEMENMGGYSDNGAADARYNYQLAERNYYKRLFKSPGSKTTAFKNQPPVGGVGGSSTMANKESTEAEVQTALKDPHVQEYIRRRGKGVDWVKKAIENNKTPMSGTMTL